MTSVKIRTKSEKGTWYARQLYGPKYQYVSTTGRPPLPRRYQKVTVRPIPTDPNPPKFKKLSQVELDYFDRVNQYLGWTKGDIINKLIHCEDLVTKLYEARDR